MIGSLSVLSYLHLILPFKTIFIMWATIMSYFFIEIFIQRISRTKLNSTTIIISFFPLHFSFNIIKKALNLIFITNILEKDISNNNFRILLQSCPSHKNQYIIYFVSK